MIPTTLKAYYKPKKSCTSKPDTDGRSQSLTLLTGSLPPAHIKTCQIDAN